MVEAKELFYIWRHRRVVGKPRGKHLGEFWNGRAWTTAIKFASIYSSDEAFQVIKKRFSHSVNQPFVRLCSTFKPKPKSRRKKKVET